MSQSQVSLLERGLLIHVSIAAFRRILGALDARDEIRINWQGGEADRLLDRRHARLVEVVIRVLRGRGWDARAEVTFASYGERGSVDALAWNEAAGAILLIEVKSQIYSVEDTLRRFQAKIRLAAVITEATLGWKPRIVGAALVLPDSSGTRRRIDAHGATFASTFPQRGRDVQAWLRAPDKPLSAIWFLSNSDLVSATEPGARRIRVRRDPPPSDTHFMGTGREIGGAAGGLAGPGPRADHLPPTPSLSDGRAELARAGFVLDGPPSRERG